MRYTESWVRHRAPRGNHDGEQAESKLWSRLRGEQVHGLRCDRYRAIGTFQVDFYIPAVKLVIEIDSGGQMNVQSAREDAARGVYLRSLGLYVIRFTSLQVLNEIDSVMDDLCDVVEDRLAGLEVVRIARGELPLPALS